MKTPILITLAAASACLSMAQAQTTILPIQSGGGALPSGWTSVNNVTANDIDRGDYWLVDAGSPGDLIVSSSYDLSAYTEVTVSVDVASFGGGGHNELKVEYSTDAGATWNATSYQSATTTGSSYITGGPITIDATFSSITQLRFSNTGSSGRGIRIQNLGITADTGAADTTPPNLTGTIPSAGNLEAAIDTALTLSFDENVQAGTGFISLYDAGGLVEQFDVTTDALFVGSDVTVTPSSPLTNSTAYYVQVGGAAVTDDAAIPNTFAGIADTTTFNFTTSAYVLAAPGDIVVTEIMQNPDQTGDSDGEWFEIFNAAASPIDLNGWLLTNATGTKNHTISNGAPLGIAPGQYLVLGINDDFATNGGVTVDYQYPSSYFLGNGTDQIVLENVSGTEIDRVEWDDGSTFPDPTGASMALDLPSSDNNVGANWSISSAPFGDGDFGSPGAANPAPATFALGLNNNPISESAGFSASTLTITRSNTSGDLEVTISADDPSELQAQSSTVLILDGDADETVDLDAIDDLWEDGDQIVTISVSAPGYTGNSQTITVQDDADVNSLIINEVYQGPDGNLGDANGDSISPTFDDEFIEIVNVGATPYDLSFCSIIENGFDFNARGPVHFFPEGTILAPGAALVVFAGGNISDGSTAAFGTAEIQKATEGGLFLSDGGDNIRLRDSFDQELFGVLLPDVSGALSTDSLTLSPDLDTTSPFVSHSSLPSSLDFSPGTEIDGTTPFVTITDSLGLTVNTASVGEEAGTAPAAITVSLPSNAAADTIIRLESSNGDELFIQDTVTITSGTSSGTVDVFPVSDEVDDGDQVITITASLSGFLNASGNITVVDDDETFTDLVINEVDADTQSTDTAEFIELFNRTGAMQSLDGLVLVFFNGSDNRSYGDAIDLTGQTIDPNGFFVIGNSGVPNVDLIVPDDSIQNGPDAVALFTGADTASYPNDTPVAMAPGTLVDAIVYDTNDSDNLNLITALTPGNPQVNEADGAVGSDSESSSRVPDGGASFDTNLFVIQAPTPGATNVLPDNNYSTWAAEQVPPVGGPEVDSDLDGILNLMEYALGLDPNVADGPPGSLVGGSLTFMKGPDAKNNENLTYVIETSNDLGVMDTWEADGAAVDTTDDISIDLFTAGGSNTKFFGRLSVTEDIPPVE